MAEATTTLVRSKRDSWVMPAECSACGEACDGEGAKEVSCVLESHMEGNTRSTTYLTLKFPECDACKKAASRKAVWTIVSGLSGFAVGAAGWWFFVLRDYPPDVSLEWWQIIGWFVAAIGGVYLLALAGIQVWQRTASADEIRREALDDNAVSMELNGADLRFQFANAQFAERFGALNP